MTEMTYYPSEVSPVVRPRAALRLFTGLALTAILLLAVWLHFYGLDKEGYANAYYAATVKSMLTSPQNFFFGSFDPGGFVTVDKPPLGLWFQAVSALVFGYSGWALLFPQALAGVLSVGLLFYLVQRVFGSGAGLLAALILTVTPISVAANRNNTMDSTLVLVLLVAAWAVSLAVESGKLRWLFVTALLVGIGFNIKMLQAVMVVPALYGVYFVAAPIAWVKRIIHLGLATLLLAVVSLAWPLAVDLTPADQRPYIGSSTNNTVMELIVGHNGAERLGVLAGLVNGGRPPNGGQPSNNNQPGQPPSDGRPNQSTQLGQGGPFNPNQGQPTGPNGGQPAGQVGQPQGPGGPGQETGDVGLFRLFNQQLAGQASWLLPLALVGLVLASLSYKLVWPLGRQHSALLLWGLWLIPQIVFFSFAGLFHRYYLEMLSPAIAVLAGVGLVRLWYAYREGNWQGWLLPVVLVASAVFESVLLIYFPDWARWLAPTLLGLAALGGLGLLVARFLEKDRRPILSSIAFGLALLAIMLAPSIWSFTPVLAQGDAGLPYAGPDLLNRRGNSPPALSQNVSQNPLIDYLLTNRAGAKFILATNSANQAAPFIIATGEPVMAMGGFSGGDRILTVDQLAAKVDAGEVRFFLISDDRRGGAELNGWITSRCQPVPPSTWGGSPASAQTGPGGGPNSGRSQLYDCRS